MSLVSAPGLQQSSFSFSFAFAATGVASPSSGLGGQDGFRPTGDLFDQGRMDPFAQQQCQQLMFGMGFMMGCMMSAMMGRLGGF
ncbi:MAG: hypothetical protein FJX76_26155, partial [Armatimonadetes bacterium]|nr:hypothetical protein [Armatimonadota bacterium]